MKKLQYEFISRAGNLVNEDFAYANESVAWVLDGSTGLSDQKITATESDAKWFVQKWNEYLMDNIFESKKSIEVIVEEGISYITSLFYEECSNIFIKDIQKPSASVAIVRIKESVIEYFLLGDCTLLIKKNNGEIVKLKDKLLEKIDNEVISDIQKIRKEEKISHSQAIEVIRSKLIKNRLLKNSENGYWILEFNKDAIGHGITGEIKINEVDNIVIMTDGYSVIVDTYKYYSDNELINVLDNNTCLNVYNIIRKIEEEDLGIDKYPRLKKSDDASIVFYRFKNQSGYN